MQDDAQRARRRAHNAHALERCNAMGRTAGSILWQPLENRAGKWFMPDGSELVEAPIEWRSERLSTILDEMDERQAVAAVADPGKAYVESLDVEKWKAETSAQFIDDGPREQAVEMVEHPDPVMAYRIDGNVWHPVKSEPLMAVDSEGAFTIDSAGAMRHMPPSTISLEELEKSIMTDHAPTTIEPPEPMLQFFTYAHLPPGLQVVSKPFGEMAENLVRVLPRNPERSAALRKLLEAKDCAVRASIYK